MSIPATRGIVQVLEQVEEIVNTELAARLATFSTESGLTLTAPAVTWRSRWVPTGAYPPGVGIYDERTVYDISDALGAHDAVHSIAIVVWLSSEVGPSDLTDYEEARRWYCLAVAQVVEAHLPTADYAGVHGVYRCDPVETQAAEAVYDEDSSRWNQLSLIRMTARQRVLAPTP